MPITKTQEEILQSYLGIEGCFIGTVTIRNEENHNLYSSIRYLKNTLFLEAEAFNRFLVSLQASEDIEVINALHHIYTICNNQTVPFQYDLVSGIKDVSALEHFLKGTGELDIKMIQQRAYSLVKDSISFCEGQLSHLTNKKDLEIEDLHHRVAQLPTDYIFKHSSGTLDTSLPVILFTPHRKYSFFPWYTGELTLRQYIVQLIKTNPNKALNIIEAIEQFDVNQYQSSRKTLETALDHHRGPFHYEETMGNKLYRLLLNEPQTLSEMTTCLKRVNDARDKFHRTWKQEPLEKQLEFESIKKLNLFLQESNKISFSYQQYQHYRFLCFQNIFLQFRNRWVSLKELVTDTTNTSISNESTRSSTSI